MANPKTISLEILERLRSAEYVVALTGSGISAESGVPTFRGREGMWEKFRPEELANINAFMRNPGLVWEWYQHRQKLIREVSPNPAHYALAAMERHYPRFDLVTQNVDGLHRIAGSQNVWELHGNIMRNRCIQCGRRYDAEDFHVEEDGVPHCDCGGYIRPDVVWFGEQLPEETLHGAYQAAEACDVFFSIGTSALVQPAGSLPLIALGHDALVVEINTEHTQISDSVHLSLEAKAGEVLPLILRRIGIEGREF